MSKSDPATDYFAITKSDSTRINPGFRALWVGTGGDVAVKRNASADTAVVFKNVPDGFMLPVEGKYVMSTGTTASDIVGVR